ELGTCVPGLHQAGQDTLAVPLEVADDGVDLGERKAHDGQYRSFRPRGENWLRAERRRASGCGFRRPFSGLERARLRAALRSLAGSAAQSALAAPPFSACPLPLSLASGRDQ